MAKKEKAVIYAKKSLLPGTYTEVSEDEKDDASFAILDKDLHQKILAGYFKSDEAEKDLKDLQNKYEELVDEYNDLVHQYNADIQNKVNDANEKAENAIKKYKAIKEENEVLKIKNASLHRQYIQTVNKQKGLTPAKTHSGYCLKQDNPRSQYSRRKGRIVLFREAIITTPYELSIEMAEVEDYIKEDISSKEIIEALCIGEKTNYINFDDYIYSLVEYSDGNHDHYFYGGLRMNTRDNCWEMVLYHQDPITKIPENMKPESLIKKDKQKNNKSRGAVLLEDDGFEYF